MKIERKEEYNENKRRGKNVSLFHDTHINIFITVEWQPIVTNTESVQMKWNQVHTQIFTENDTDG